MKKFLITVTVLSILILTACAPAPTVTSVPSETPTIQPSSTPTATSTPEPTIEATATQPATPVNPGFVEGVGNITSVVKRESDEKYYGINELGMAVTVQNEKGEWVPYDRPMGLAQYGGVTDPPITLESLGLKEIQPEEVTRIQGGKIKSYIGSVNDPTNDELKKVYKDDLPFGVVFEEKPFANSTDQPEMKDFTHVYVSGINRGTKTVKIYDVGLPNNSEKFLILEVPLQFESQILLIPLPDQKNANDAFLIPESNNIQDAEHKPMSYHDIMNALSANKSVGDQIVVAFQINLPPGFGGEQHNGAYKELVNALENGSAVNVDFGAPTPTRIYMLEP